MNAASCSVAPARLPSVVITSGAMPCMTRRVASRTVVRVLPAPGGPVSIIGGACAASGKFAECQRGGDRSLQVAVRQDWMQFPRNAVPGSAARRAGSVRNGSGSVSGFQCGGDFNAARDVSGVQDQCVRSQIRPHLGHGFGHSGSAE